MILRCYTAWILGLGTLLCCSPLAAKIKGIGVVIGSPTGISGKLWNDGRNAWAGALGWQFEGDENIYLHGDYLWHNDEATQELKANTDFEGHLLFHYGLGGRLLLGNEGRLGVRVPLGVDYLFPNKPFDIFFEIAPLLELVPGTEFRMNGGIGFRYSFD